MTGSSFAYSPSRQSTGRGANHRCVRIKTFQPSRNVTVHARQPPAVFAVAIVDDKSVPEAHKGLHGLLYGDGGSEEHESGSFYTIREGEDEGAIVMPVPAYLESRDSEKPLGVYCVYDAHHAPQYIGYSRNMVLAVKGHLARVGAERCAHVRTMVYGNRAMASRANLERGVANWVRELPELEGRTPAGNEDPELRVLWEGAASGSSGSAPLASPAPLDPGLMSPPELAAYAEKKLKLRKAMGEVLVEGPGGAGPAGGSEHDHEGEEDDLTTRRLKLMKAMNRGDWSAVISAQTQEALAADGGDEATAAATTAEVTGSSGGGAAGGPSSAGEVSTSDSSGGGGGIVSPFQQGGAAGVGAAPAPPAGSAAPRVLTVEAVQAALEEVRPYLMADGGDVEVVEVRDGVVYLRLQGACSSCPSQSATMKGGIERVIRQTFGNQVRDILQLDRQDPGASVARVDSALNMLRGAIANLGGSAEVLSVEGGVCTIRYRGPPAIGKGVQGAVRDTFPDIREVRLVD